jgi:hypothetical protein
MCGRRRLGKGAYPSGDALLRNPITGIAGCCARAVSGNDAAAPPNTNINSRRLIADMKTLPTRAA